MQVIRLHTDKRGVTSCRKAMHALKSTTTEGFRWQKENLEPNTEYVCFILDRHKKHDFQVLRKFIDEIEQYPDKTFS